MDTEQIIAKVNQVLIEEFELEADMVIPTASLVEDLDLDSLDAVDLIVALEKTFGIRVDPDVLVEVRTVGEMHDYVRTHCGSEKQVEAAKQQSEGV